VGGTGEGEECYVGLGDDRDGVCVGQAGVW